MWFSRIDLLNVNFAKVKFKKAKLLKEMSKKFREFSNHPSSIWEIKIELMKKKKVYIYGNS